MSNVCHTVYFGPTDLLEYRLKCGEVGMNVVDRSNAHDEIPLIEVTQIDVT